MAKKGDILVKLYKDFPGYLESYKTRLNELEREFLHAKNDYDSYLLEIDSDFNLKEDKLTNDFLQTELVHSKKLQEIGNEFNERFALLQRDMAQHSEKTQDLIASEDDIFQQILNQFEERKAEAFNTYMSLTKESDYQIDREMRVHHEFINGENEKLNAKRIEYQDLNSNLANQLVWTMEKAKNSLNKLSTSLLEEGNRNRDYLADVINDSLRHLNTSRDAMSALFKNTSSKFQKERDLVRNISREKRKPHSDINQEMIHTFVKQIRDVNESKIQFEKMIRREMEISLSHLYPKIIEADSNKDEIELRKLILQKEIIEKKADYLLNRNQTMSDLLIGKYQNEIKKIKIDSFKRSEEIKLAYSVPEAFYQNSINVYSNFAFYLNETYEELGRMLSQFKDFNKEYIEYKENYIHTSQKTFEDYKINLLVKVNNLTSHLTEYISQIDQLSNEIITLESNNRLEIAEIRKKMENLEVFGDYQKYIASLENDLFFAMFQHNKNLEKIQIESNYTNNLLNINRDVLLLNQNKLEYSEFQEYMLTVAQHEKIIQASAKDRKIAESKAMYKQKIDQVLALSHIAHERIVYNAKRQNFEHAASYVRYMDSTNRENEIGSERIIEYVHHVQNLIDLNIDQTKKIRNYLEITDDNHAYLRALEQNRIDLLAQVDNTTNKKNRICVNACELYEKEIQKTLEHTDQVFNKYLLLLKEELLKLHSVEIEPYDILDNSGYRDEILSVIQYVYNLVSQLAYKYQVPLAVSKLDLRIDSELEEFVVRNLETFRKAKSYGKSLSRLKTYLIETISQIDEFQEFNHEILSLIMTSSTANDRKFIQRTLDKAQKTKKVINREYDSLQYSAFRIGKSKTKQLSHLEKHTEKLNNVYKSQVSNINKEFLNKVQIGEEIGDQIARKFLRMINRNNKELNNMLKFLDILAIKEKRDLEKQYQHFEKSLTSIDTFNANAHQQELIYIQNLYQAKNVETSKTIQLLENKINNLPVEKESYYLQIKKERFALETVKNQELQKKLAEIERDKFISRPKFITEIAEVKKRLPEDYVDLYNRIQKLEFDYLNQFGKINEEYSENYKEYLSSQTGNNVLLDTESKLYEPFGKMEKFNENIIKNTTQTYRDTIAKSKKTRDDLKKESQKSTDKQKRIINV